MSNYDELLARLESIAGPGWDLPEQAAAAIRELLARDLQAKLREVEAATIERCANEIPTSWCDPLLTGPDAVIKGNITNPQVELLLTQLVKRIRALAPERTVAGQDETALEKVTPTQNDFHKWSTRTIKAPASPLLPGLEPVHADEVMVPLSEIINTPCQGCGKRPIDFVTGAEISRLKGEP